MPLMRNKWVSIQACVMPQQGLLQLNVNVIAITDECNKSKRHTHTHTHTHTHSLEKFKSSERNQICRGIGSICPDYPKWAEVASEIDQESLTFVVTLKCSIPAEAIILWNFLLVSERARLFRRIREWKLL